MGGSLPRRPGFQSYSLPRLSSLYANPTPAPVAPVEPEYESSIGNALANAGGSVWNAARGLLNTGSAAMGAVAGDIPLVGGVSYRTLRDAVNWSTGEDTLGSTDAAYRRSLQGNWDSASDNGRRDLSWSEMLENAPGPGHVLAESFSPGTPTTGIGRVAKNVGSLAGDIALDPLNLATGGLGAAGTAAKEGKYGLALARGLGSAPAGLVYAPDVIEGTYESGKQAIGDFQAGDYGAAAEHGSQALLTGGLGLLMGKGIASEAADGRAANGLAGQAERQAADAAAMRAQVEADMARGQQAPPAPVDPGFQFPEQPFTAPNQPNLDTWLGDVPPGFRQNATQGPSLDPTATLELPRDQNPLQRTEPPLEALAPPTTASVPFMVTRRMEAELGQLGYDQGAINSMAPAEARRILDAREAPAKLAEAVPDGLGEMPGVRNADVSAENGQPTIPDAPIIPKTETVEVKPGVPLVAYRARDVGEQGIPGAGHAQASTSEADVRRMAPSRTEKPQEVVSVDLTKLDPADYEIVQRGPGEAPWVRFTKELPEQSVLRVGDVDAVDIAAASKADPPVVEAVAGADTADLAQAAGLSLDQATKGAADVKADGVREFSPEAVAIKRAVLQTEAERAQPPIAPEPAPLVDAPPDLDAFTAPEQPFRLPDEPRVPEKTLVPGEQYLLDQVLARGADRNQALQLMKTGRGREVLREFARSTQPGQNASVVSPDGMRAPATIRGRLFDENASKPRRPELEARQIEAMQANPEAAQPFVDSAVAAVERGQERTARRQAKLGDVEGRTPTTEAPEYLKAPEGGFKASLDPVGDERAAFAEASRVPEMVAEDAPKYSVVDRHQDGPESLPRVVRGQKVGGLDVGDGPIKNTDSIAAGWNDGDYETLGVRSVPLSLFDSDPKDLFYAKNDLDRAVNLAEQIKASGRIDPLIVVYDGSDPKPYVLEGGHRLGALHMLGVKEFPALVVDARGVDVPGAAPKYSVVDKKEGAAPPKFDTQSPSEARDADTGPIESDRPEAIRAAVEKAFPTGKVGDLEGGGHLVELPNGKLVHVSEVGKIRYSKQAFEAGRGREKITGEEIVGSWKAMPEGGIIQLTKTAPIEPTVLHESFHAAMNMALSDAEKAAVLKRYGSEEAAADAYAKWNPARTVNSWFSKVLAFAKRLGEAFTPTHSERVFDKVRSGKAFAKNATLPDMLIEAWKSGLVSAPGTQLANPVANLGEAAVRSVESALAGVIDRALGGQRTRFTGEALEQLKGAVVNMPKAAKVLADGFGKLASSEGKIPGKAGGVARVPFAAMELTDNATGALNEGAMLRALAFRQAAAEGHNGPARWRRRDELMANPSEALKAKVLAEVRNRQFKDSGDDPSSLISKINNLRDKHKWLNIPLPFTSTPGAIAKIAIQRSPLGFKRAFDSYSEFRRALKDGSPAERVAELKGRAVDDITRPLLGTVAMGLFAMYAKSGGMTGSGPTDQREKALLRATGWQEYSFRVQTPDGVVYVPFTRLEPASVLLGFAADVAEAKDSKTAGDAFEKGLGSFVKNLTSARYLQGLSDAAELINDPKRFASQYASNLAASTVPNVVRKATQSIDPIVRDTRSSDSGPLGIPERIVKSVMAGIPGVSTMLPERRAGTGETIERDGNAVSRFLSPVQITKERGDRALEKLMVEVGASQSAPSKEVTIPNTGGRKVRLTTEETAYVQGIDKLVTDRLRGIVKRPQFLKMAPDQQRDYIERLYQRAGSEATKRILSSPTFRRRAATVLLQQRAEAT